MSLMLVPIKIIRILMLTDKEWMNIQKKRNNYYTLDKSLYPRTPETRGGRQIFPNELGYEYFRKSYLP